MFVKLFNRVVDRNASDQINARLLFQLCYFAVIKISRTSHICVDR
ncbi:hypothetical protein D1BOALGB6SA_6921 [Olavius sp. associated proteobacterium Delta 1]|nr:hypothetical protein D1BOALGB6SA_6921 [Olavius sp. associated proteobacterium Delta 1]